MASISASNSKPRRASQSKLGRSERILIRKIGLKIHQTLFENHRPVEWLSFKTGVARSSIREIIAGRSNPRILTIDAIARGLEFKGITDFLVALQADRSVLNGGDKKPEPKN